MSETLYVSKKFLMGISYIRNFFCSLFITLSLWNWINLLVYDWIIFMWLRLPLTWLPKLISFCYFRHDFFFNSHLNTRWIFKRIHSQKRLLKKWITDTPSWNISLFFSCPLSFKNSAAGKRWVELTYQYAKNENEKNTRWKLLKQKWKSTTN